MSAAYIIAARRTPIGKMLGGLATVSAPRLGAAAISAALADAEIDAARVDEVIFGNVLSAGVGQAPARQAALAAGIPDTVGALTINKVCGSGLKAVMLADQAIRAGDAQIVVAGGMENMSQAPHLLLGSRGGWKFGHQQMIDSMLHDGLFCSHEHCGMGSLADGTASRWNISRADQDSFALESHHRAVAARERGRFSREIAAVHVASGKSDTLISHDEGPRAGSALADLERLRPAFAADGSATAGNASQISDGSAALVVSTEQIASTSRSSIKARIVASATKSLAPKDLFIAPVGAIERVLDKARLKLSDIDLVELNEAFASQCLACMCELGLDHARVNVHGGAIALGHPIGASGARILVTLLHALADRGLRRGLAALCLGGGEAVAMIIERV